MMQSPEELSAALGGVKLSDAMLALDGGTVATVGCGGKRIYGSLTSHYVLLNASGARQKTFDLLSTNLPNASVIIHFYEWDNVLDSFTEAKYIEKLTEWRDKFGVRCCCQFDQSVWHQDTVARQLGSIVHNFKYARIAQSLGYRVVFNFNNVLLRYLSAYACALPPTVPTVSLDASHSEEAYARQESEALGQFIRLFEVKDLIIRTGKRYARRLGYVLKPARAQGVRVHFFPQELYFMAHPSRLLNSQHRNELR